MKIGCLQFAPHVGDVHNNLNRADAVLSKGENLEELDLLVLPELAFTGYNFRSLAEIAPCLEPAGSGISALWARTIALKHNCTVIVGYPEKVDVSQKWPTSPEYYNSALIVGKDGETIANYRKSHLYAVDEKWALEGQDGFFEGRIDGLGNTALGICMDLNPYKFEAPWHAFEFAFHCLEVEANLIIISMAWLTTEEQGDFSRLPLEPDFSTLEYWVQRLEPIIRSENNEEEIIVVFCNRTGSEGDAVYAGTSSVIGILDGEVNLYGVLGRGVKDLLVVDTDRKPFAKLVRVGEDDEKVATDNSNKGSQTHTPGDPSPGQQQPLPANSFSGTPPGPQPSNSSQANGSERNGSMGKDSREPRQPRKDDTQHSSNTTAPQAVAIPQTAKANGSQRLTRAALSRTPLPELTLQIPDSMISPAPKFFKSPAEAAQHGTPMSGLSGANDIPTPTAPSPTPLSVRPKFPFPESKPHGPQTHSATPSKINTNVSRVKRIDTPITPPRTANSKARQPVAEPIAEKPPSPPSDDESAFPKPAAAERRTADGPRKSSTKHKANEGARETPQKQASPVLQPVAYVPVRPPSTKSRNASKTRRSVSVDHLDDDFGRNRSRDRSRMAIPLIASPSLFDQGAPGQQRQHSETPIFFQPDAYPVGWTPQPEYQQRLSETPYDRRSDSPYGTVASIENLKAGDMPSRQPSRPVSRGRQPVAKRGATNGIMGNQQWSNVAASRAVENHEQSASKQRSAQPVHQRGPSAGSGKPRRQSASGPSRSSSANWLYGTASPMRTHPPVAPGDEIVAVINLVGDSCPLHNVVGSQSGSVPPQAGRQRHEQHQHQHQHQPPQKSPPQQSQHQQPQHQHQQNQQQPPQKSSPQQSQHQHQQQHQQQPRPQQPQRQPSQQPASGTTVQPRHRSAAGAPREAIPAQSASVPPAGAGAGAAKDGVYELVLPSHIRELVESMTRPESRDPFLSRGLERRVGTSTPKTFNPPTPTAMQFPSDDDKAASA